MGDAASDWPNQFNRPVKSQMTKVTVPHDGIATVIVIIIHQFKKSRHFSHFGQL